MFNNRKHIGISTGFNSGNGLSPKRSGIGATPLISTMKHEWYFNNVQNASANIITIPDTGTVGGLNISNPALANKPTQSSIGTKISYATDGVDDYLYKATTNFMRSMPTWMVTVVFKYDSSVHNMFISMFNENNNSFKEGVRVWYNNIMNQYTIAIWDNMGNVTFPLIFSAVITNGNNYIITYAYNGTQVKLYNQNGEIYSSTKSNPVLTPSGTTNVSIFADVANNNTFGKGNIGYIGVDEFDLTRLNANVATLKSEFGI